MLCVSHIGKTDEIFLVIIEELNFAVNINEKDILKGRSLLVASPLVKMLKLLRKTNVFGTPCRHIRSSPF